MERNKFMYTLYNDLYDNYGYTAARSFKAPLLSLSKILPQLPANWILLDLGCSRGLFLSEIKELYSSNCSLFGIDISHQAISDANKINEINCSQADILNTPYDDEFFDVIHTSNTLEHLLEEDREQSIKEAWRILKPGGLFFGDVATTYESYKGTHTEALKKYNIRDLHINPLSADQWVEIFKANGFNVIWQNIFMRDDCRHKKDGFTTCHGQCHLKFTCKKEI